MIDKKNRSQAVIGREQFVDIELSSAEILALFGTPKTLVPGPTYYRASCFYRCRDS